MVKTKIHHPETCSSRSFHGEVEGTKQIRKNNTALEINHAEKRNALGRRKHDLLKSRSKV